MFTCLLSYVVCIWDLGRTKYKRFSAFFQYFLQSVDVNPRFTVDDFLIYVRLTGDISNHLKNILMNCLLSDNCAQDSHRSDHIALQRTFLKRNACVISVSVRVWNPIFSTTASVII